eukprot:2213607-Alexandrium_andersonii.AAC.2
MATTVMNLGGCARARCDAVRVGKHRMIHASALLASCGACVGGGLAQARWRYDAERMRSAGGLELVGRPGLTLGTRGPVRVLGAWAPTCSCSRAPQRKYRGNWNRAIQVERACAQ